MSGTNTVVGSSPAQDFWRSSAGTLQPDGTADYTEGISHNGLIGVRLANGTPVALIDGEYGTRTGTDGRVTGQPFYVTSNTMPGLAGAATGAAYPNTTGGAEVRHTNQSAGVGIAYNGLYLTGQTNLDFNFVQRGSGQYNFGFQVASGVANTNVTSSALLAANTGHQHRKWLRNQIVSTEVDQINADGASGLFYKQMRGKGGTYATAFRVQEAYPSAGGGDGAGITTFAVGEHTVHDQKLSLYGFGNALSFYGFGMEGAAMLAMIPNSGDSFRTRRGSDRFLLHQIGGTGNLTIGGATASKPGGGAWTATSDSRVKDNVAALTSGMERVRALSPKTFRYKASTGLPATVHTGVIAQDAQADPLTAGIVVSTPAEAGSPMATTAGTTAVLGVDPSAVLWWLVDAVQDLDAASSTSCPSWAGLDNTTVLADQHNLAAPPGGKGYRITGSDGKAITGLAGGGAGACRVLLNTAASKKTVLRHEDAGSAAANRIRLPGGADMDLESYGSVVLSYDTVLSRWLVSRTGDKA